MPLEHPFAGWRQTMVVGRNIFAILADQPTAIDFLHVPPTTSRQPSERWSIPNFPFVALRYATHPPEDILVVAEETEGWVDTIPFIREPAANSADRL